MSPWPTDECHWLITERPDRLYFQLPPIPTFADGHARDFADDVLDELGFSHLDSPWARPSHTTDHAVIFLGVDSVTLSTRGCYSVDAFDLPCDGVAVAWLARAEARGSCDVFFTQSALDADGTLSDHLLELDARFGVLRGANVRLAGGRPN